RVDEPAHVGVLFVGEQVLVVLRSDGLEELVGSGQGALGGQGRGDHVEDGEQGVDDDEPRHDVAPSAPLELQPGRAAVDLEVGVGDLCRHQSISFRELERTRVMAEAMPVWVSPEAHAMSLTKLMMVSGASGLVGESRSAGPPPVGRYIPLKFLKLSAELAPRSRPTAIMSSGRVILRNGFHAPATSILAA